MKVTTGARWSVAGFKKASSGPVPDVDFLVELRFDERFACWRVDEAEEAPFSLVVGGREDLLLAVVARVSAPALEFLASSVYPSSSPEVVCCKKKDSNSSDPSLEEEDEDLEESSDPTEDSSSL